MKETFKGMYRNIIILIAKMAICCPGPRSASSQEVVTMWPNVSKMAQEIPMLFQKNAQVVSL